jgi:hypothetical protein
LSVFGLAIISNVDADQAEIANEFTEVSVCNKFFNCISL